MAAIGTAQRISTGPSRLSGRVLEKLCDDGNFVLSRALANDGEETFLVCAPALSLSSADTSARLRHILALHQELDGAFATTPRELVEEDGRPVLILDDPGATLLASTVGSPWELLPFLRVACGMAAALAGLHARSLVHKDVRPGNFFVDVAEGKAWLTGFGIASRLPRERPALAPPEVIAGTLAYMSPEQTGRMNRSIDSRSDLYSLGITLHEMATGGLPFHAADAIEWIHCHIAREPAAAPQLPEPLAAIVRKLLAKNAEDRYQTALGLEFDLRRCLGDLETRGRIDAFTLGQRDSSERLLIPERLYGRDSDVEALRAALERVIESGQPELVLVSGYSGIGKSSVVSELHRLLVPSRSRFASGKFDQYQRDIPYATVAHAFQTLVREVLGKRDSEVSAWSERILEAVGSNAQLLTGLIPELALVIGEQPKVPDLPPQEARNRFQMVLRLLLGAFSKQEPLVLFLDDLQWLDSATVDLIESLFTGTPVPNLLLIGAYRDNEVGPEHPLTSAITRIRESGAALNQVVLGSLSSTDIEQLVADSLRSGRERVVPLARLIYEKTGGNPFFAIQFLDGLVGERLVVHDPTRGAWSWEPARVFAKGFTDNVVDFMVARLERLPAPTQAAMRHLACLGNTTALTTLELVHGALVDDAMWDAIRAGLVFRGERSYCFLHDRVQEAAYALIPEGQRSSEHLRIGRLLETLSDAESDERVFEIANQKNRGAELIVDPGERRSLATLNVRAGQRAKRSVAYVSARNHFAQAAALIEPDAWSCRYRDTFDLFLLFSECEYLVGNFARADELFELLLARAVNDLDRSSVYVLRMRVYQVAGKYADAVDAALMALRLFGVVFPDGEAEIAAATAVELAQIPTHLGSRAIGDLLDAPEVTVPEVRAVIDLLCEASPCAYIGRPMLFPLLMLRAVNVCLQHGNTDQTSYVYGIYAVMLVGIASDIPAAFEFSQLSLRVNEKFDNPRLTGTLLHLHGDHVRFWRRPFAEGLPILERAFVTCPQVGDLVYAGFLAFEVLWQLIECYERASDVLVASTRYADFARQSNNEPIYQTIRLEQQFLKCLQGQTRGALSFDEPDGSFDEARSFAAVVNATFGCGIFFYHAMKLIVAYMNGQYAEALRSAARAEPNIGAAMAMPIEATFHFYHALTRLAVMPAERGEARDESARLVTATLGKLAEWARHCPENFASRHALVAAEQARVEGRIADALPLYEAAMHAAREQRQRLNEGLAHELCARFMVGLGSTTSARAHATLARQAYESWGALRKVEQLDQEYPGSSEPLAPPARTPTATTAISDLDLATVVKVSHAVSAEIVLDKLIERLLTLALENAGASRGLLVLAREGELYVEAEALAIVDAVEVHTGTSNVTTGNAPESILRYVARTRESVIIGDATARGPFADDPYLGTVRVRSLLCLPLVKQTRLIGLLYLENRLAPNVFTPQRIVLLELLASQSAISLENAQLHADLRTTQDGLQRALRDNRLMVDAVPIHAWATRPDGFVEQLSKPWLDYTGMSREEALGWGWTAAFHPDDAPEIGRVWHELISTGKAGEVEGRMRRHDGVYRWFLLRTKPLIDDNGQVLRWYGTNTDIDDLKRAEDELRRNERFLAEGQRLNNTGSFSWSLGTDQMTLSKEMYRIYEFEPGLPITLQHMVERTLPEDVPLLAEKIELARRGVVDHDYEFRLRLPDGSLKHLRTNAYATHDRDGNLQFLGVIQDITDRKLAEEALTKVRSEVASMTRAASLGALTATIAHEVNQPLTGIMTNTSTCLRVLSAPTPNLESALSLVNRIARDGKRAAEVIVRLRALFGNKQAMREPVDLNDATREALALSRSELDRNSVVIKTELAERLPQVSGDRIQLQQVILNFLLNASEAMRTVDDRRRELVVRTELDGDAVRLSVQDGGVGLQPDEIDKLFEAFYTTKASGMGIGLYVSRSIIETHGGRIWAVQSATGAGATFLFSIPFDANARDGNAPPVA